MLPADSRPTAPRASLRPSADNALPPLKAGKLLDQLRERIRMLHYPRNGSSPSQTLRKSSTGAVLR